MMRISRVLVVVSATVLVSACMPGIPFVKNDHQKQERFEHMQKAYVDWVKQRQTGEKAMPPAFSRDVIIQKSI